MRPVSRFAIACPTLGVALVLAIAGTTGCADEGPGSLIIPVQLGNNKDCDEIAPFEVTTLRAVLDRSGETYEEETDCSVGEVRIDGVAPGSYDLLVQGLADDGVGVMDNLGGDVLDARVIGDGANTTLETVRLTDAPARLRVAWDFDFSSCNDAGITEFEVTAYAVGGTSDLLTSEIDCEEPTDVDGKFHSVPDEDRQINGNVVGEAEVRPVDSSGNTVGNTVSFQFDPPGPGHAIELEIQCNSDGCVEN